MGVMLSDRKVSDALPAAQVASAAKKGILRAPRVWMFRVSSFGSSQVRRMLAQWYWRLPWVDGQLLLRLPGEDAQAAMSARGNV